MQVSLSSTGPLERRLTVQVSEEQISTEVQNRLKSISRTARIDGFRPGKAPMRVVEQRFGPRVRDEVVGEVLRRSFADAVTQERLRPAGRPVFDPLSSNPGQGLSYTATFEVYPEVTLKPVNELKVTKIVCEVTEPDVDRMIETLRSQRRIWQAVDRGAKKGDRVTLDFKGTIDGAEFSGGSAENFELEVGAGRFITGFEDGLVGRGVGEHHLKVSFPADYHRQDYAGKDAEFEVNVKQVAEAVLPAADEEFFKAFGVREGGLEAFRAEVRRNMERERDQAVKSLTKDKVLNALLDANTLQLPKALVENEAHRLLHETQRNLLTQGLPRERVEGMKPDPFREQAQRRVGLGLLMADIIQRNSLKAEGTRVRARIEQLAASYDDPAAVVKWYYEDEQRLNDVQMAVLEEQAVEWLVGQAQVEEKHLSFDDLMNPRQTGKPV